MGHWSGMERVFDTDMGPRPETGLGTLESRRDDVAADQTVAPDRQQLGQHPHGASGLVGRPVAASGAGCRRSGRISAVRMGCSRIPRDRRCRDTSVRSRRDSSRSSARLHEHFEGSPESLEDRVGQDRPLLQLGASPTDLRNEGVGGPLLAGRLRRVEIEADGSRPTERRRCPESPSARPRPGTRGRECRERRRRQPSPRRWHRDRGGRRIATGSDRGHRVRAGSESASARRGTSVATAPSGKPSRVTTAAPQPSRSSATVDSLARVDAMSTPRARAPGCEPSPSVTTTTANFDTEVVHALQQSSGSEHLVVRMRRDDDKATGRRDPQRWQASEPPRREPRALVRAGMHLVDD